MNKERIKVAFENFRKKFQFGKDEMKLPDFYQEMTNKLLFDGVGTEKLVFIMVVHVQRAAFHYVNFIAELGPIAAIIPKTTKELAARNIQETFDTEFADCLWPQDKVNRDALLQPENVADVVLKIQEQHPGHRLVILDHGGYFAPMLDVLEMVCEKPPLIVEHTLNGEQGEQGKKSYIKKLSEMKKLNDVPAFLISSIATTQFKGRENDIIAEKVVDAIKTMVFGDDGLNQDLARLQYVTVIGCGRIGASVAHALRRLKSDRMTIAVCDVNQDVLESAKNNGFVAVNVAKNEEEREKYLAHSDLIITAASGICLHESDYKLLKKGACIACCTSSDSQIAPLSKARLVKDDRILNTKIEVYTNVDTNTEIVLAGGGRSINFMAGGASHPFIHAEFALVAATVMRYVSVKATELNSFEIQPVHAEDTRCVDDTYKKYFPEPKPRTTCYGLYASNRLFVGRSTQLNAIRSNLTRNHKSIIVKKEKNLSARIDDREQPISGPGGIGKTALAREYVKQCLAGAVGYPHYDAIVWFDASNVHSLYENFQQIARKLAITNVDKLSIQALVTAVYAKLSAPIEGEGSILLVFDNADNEEQLNRAYLKGQVVNFMPPVTSDKDKMVTWHRLITTQNSFFANENMIRLPVMDVEDAVALITKECEWVMPEEAESLARMLDYFPLAICQAIAYLKIIKDHLEGEVDAKAILAEFRVKFEQFSRTKLHLLENEHLTAEDHYETVYATWMMSIERLALQEFVEPLMFRLSYLASQNISHEFLLRLIDTGISTKNQERLINDLKKYSLLEELKSDDSKECYWSIHSLLQTVIRLHQFKLESHDQLLRLMEILQYYANDIKNAYQFAPLIDHIWTAINHHERIASIAPLQCAIKMALLYRIATVDHYDAYESESAYKACLQAYDIFQRAPEGAGMALRILLANSAAGMGKPEIFVEVLENIIADERIYQQVFEEGTPRFLDYEIPAHLSEELRELAATQISLSDDEARKAKTGDILFKVRQNEMAIAYESFKGNTKAAVENAKVHYLATQFSSRSAISMVSARYLYVLTSIIDGRPVKNGISLLKGALAIQAKFKDNYLKFWNDQIHLLLATLYHSKGMYSRAITTLSKLWREMEEGELIISRTDGFIKRVKCLHAWIDHVFAHCSTAPVTMQILHSSYCVLGMLFKRGAETASKVAERRELLEKSISCFEKAYTTVDCSVFAYFRLALDYMFTNNRDDYEYARVLLNVVVAHTPLEDCSFILKKNDFILLRKSFGRFLGNQTPCDMPFSLSSLARLLDAYIQIKLDSVSNNLLEGLPSESKRANICENSLGLMLEDLIDIEPRRVPDVLTTAYNAKRPSPIARAQTVARQKESSLIGFRK